MLLGTVSLALAVVGSRPDSTSSAGRPGLVVALVDVSKSSVAPAGAEWSNHARATLLQLAERAARDGDEVFVLAFGRDARVVDAVESGATARARFSAADFDARRELTRGEAPLGADESALRAALEIAGAEIVGRPRARIVLVSDATWTGGDPAPIARALASRGVVFDSLPPPRVHANLSVGALSTPRRIETGAPLVVEVPVRVTGSERASPASVAGRVRVERRDASGAGDAREVSFAIRVGEDRVGTAHVFVDLGPATPGVTTLRARVSFDDARETDPIPEDDVADALVREAGARVVGVLAGGVSGDVPWLALARDSGALEGLTFVTVPREDLALRLAVLDALVTSDATVPDRLDARDVESLGAFVRGGGGWLDLPGWNWIASRARADDPLSELAALRPERAASRPREVVFLIDASGSMAGAAFEEVRAALVEMVDAALPEDDVTVRFFAEEIEPPVRLAAERRADPAARRAFAEALTRAREPRGATRILHALETLAEEAPIAGANSAGSERLVLLLSDGGDPDRADAAGRAQRVRERLAAVRTRVVAATPRDGSDVAFLETLAERVAPLAGRGADGRAHWDAVFRRELARDAARTEPDQVVHAVSDPDPLARPLAEASARTQLVDVSVRCELAPDARAFWVTADAAPLGAIARRGRGTVVTLASAPGTTWAPRFADPLALAPCLRLLARGRSSDDSDVARARLDEVRVGAWSGAAEIVVEGLDPSTPLDVRARLEDGAEGVFELVLEPDESAPDPRTTRRARLPSGFRVGDGRARVVVATQPQSLALDFDAAGAGEFAFSPRRLTLPRPEANPTANPAEFPGPGTDLAGTSERAPGREPRVRVALFVGFFAVLLGGALWVLGRGALSRSRV